MGASIWSPGSTVTLDSASLAALFQLRGGYCGTAAGVDTIILTPTTALTAYAAGQTFTWISAGANTGPATVNISVLGPVALTKENAVALAAGDIPGVTICTGTFDGTRIVLEEIASVHKSLFTAAGDMVVSSAAGVPSRIPATADVAAHATTMNPWVARNINLTGAVVTFTDIADAPYIGAVTWIKANDAHIWTNGAVFRMPGLANYTCAADDWLRIEAVTVDTFSVAIFKADGTAVVQPTVATTPAIRQTVRLAATDSSGYNSLLSAGAALNFNISAAATPAVLDFAAGNTDYTSTLSANEADQGTLIASNTNYIHATYATVATVSWGNCLIPPQYGYAFDRSQAALLNFEGADASTVMLDDFGNTWTASGNAQIDTAQFKFGSSSLLLDGTGDYIRTANILSMGDGSWEISLWFRLNATSAVHALVTLQNGGTYGIGLAVDHNAGTRRLRLDASSTGTSSDIASTSPGAATLSLATWYKVRFVFDALAGTYRIYLSNNGAAETQDLTISSTARICASTTGLTIGTGSGGYADFNGWVDGFRFIRAATVTGTETPSASAFTIASQPVHFFSIPEMKMYEATAASVAAGSNPTLTARNRLFVGEQDTNGSAVTATRNYAIRGEYLGVASSAMVAAGTRSNVSHNIGTTLINPVLEGVIRTTQDGYSPGEIVALQGQATSTAFITIAPSINDKNSMGWSCPVAMYLVNKSTGNTGASILSSTAIGWRMRAKRGW